jgi:CubicO group peptidase (beta-lactamase class C family)
MFCYSQDFKQKLIEIKQKNNLTGISVCLVKDSRVVYSYHDGLRDVDRNLPVNENTVFRIASVSKMFTVTALMQLYEKGLFKLEEDVSKYLGFELRNPNFPDKPITFQMLMSHTSSIRDGVGYDNFLAASYSQKPFPLLSSVLLPGGTFFTEDIWSKTDAPGSNYFQYVNLNFGILGTLVERISGERFDKYCIAHIFKPLGMNASFDVRDIPDINNLAVLYRKENGKWTPQNDNWQGVRPPNRALEDYKIGSNAVLFAPQGGLRVSAADLTKFMILHMNNGKYGKVRIIADSTAKRMHQVVWSFNGSNGFSEKDFYTNYALAFMRTEKLVPGVELIGHSGDAYGLLSGLYYSEKEKFGIVFMTNGGEWKQGAYSGWQTIEEDIMTTCYRYLKPK